LARIESGASPKCGNSAGPMTARGQKPKGSQRAYLVSSASDSGHDPRLEALRLWAISGHKPSYSITSSASASSVGGTVRSSLFAVLRLITSSNLVGCMTGRSVAGARSYRPSSQRNSTAAVLSLNTTGSGQAVAECVHVARIGPASSRRRESRSPASPAAARATSVQLVSDGECLHDQVCDRIGM
jgi:hypothetical protein